MGGEAGSSGLSRVGLNTSAHNESSDEELEQHMETGEGGREGGGREGGEG